MEKMKSLTAAVVGRAKELGSDLVGVAPVERFAGAPRRMSPQGLLPPARSVIVAAIHHPDAAVELGGEPTPQDVGPYAVQYWMNSKLDDISFLLARFIEERGYAALPIAASNIWRYHAYRDLAVDFAPDLAHRYAAVAAGLGEIGWNNLALTPEFGPRNRFVSVVTAAPLDPTPMYAGEPLCDRCMECVKHCPSDVFRKETRGMTAVEIGGRRFEFPDTSKWRCAWSENFDLAHALPVPDRVDEETVRAHLERYGRNRGEEGSCLKFCMTPRLRFSDPAYCRAPRRRKAPSGASPESLRDLVAGICTAARLDAAAAGQVSLFADGGPVHPGLHLPDAVSAVSLGMRIPSGPEDRAVFRRRLQYAAMDVAHALDMAGYSAVCMTRVADALVAQRLGVFSGGTDFATVFTSAPVASFLERRTAPPATRQPGRDEVRAWCVDAGADLAGFFGRERFSEFSTAFAAAGTPLREGVIADDAGSVHGPFVPAITTRETRLQGPADRMPGWKSVIVVAVKLPGASFDTAKVTPAETAGPYVFACYEALHLLGDIAYRLVRRLEEEGYRGVMATDLTGQASQVCSCRGMLADLRSNAYPAFLAGLATIGRNGSALTPEHGVRQRFMAIVTDVPLESDALPAADPCAGCAAPCIAACPTGALGGEVRQLVIEGRSFALPAIDGYACDWAKRLGLSAAEGPRNCGIESDVPLPAERTAIAAASAASAVPWGVQKRLITIGEECIRVCPAHKRRKKERRHADTKGG